MSTTTIGTGLNPKLISYAAQRTGGILHNRFGPGFPLLGTTKCSQKEWLYSCMLVVPQNARCSHVPPHAFKG